MGGAPGSVSPPESGDWLRVRLLSILCSMELPFREDGAGLVPAYSSAPHKEDLSSKVSVERNEQARDGAPLGPRKGPSRPHGPVSALLSCLDPFILGSGQLQLRETLERARRLDPTGSGRRFGWD